MLPPLLPLVRPVSIRCATVLSPSCLALDSEPLEGKATGEILLGSYKHQWKERTKGPGIFLVLLLPHMLG